MVLTRPNIMHHKIPNYNNGQKTIYNVRKTILNTI